MNVNDFVERCKLFIKTDTARLMVTYISIIMLMCVSFSVVIYAISNDQLERQRPPDLFFRTPERNIPVSPDVKRFIDSHVNEAQNILLARLILINLLALVFGTFASYYLARRNLEPIEEAMDAQIQFVNDASHELRTPLTSLKTLNEVTLRKNELTLDDAKDTMRHSIEEADKLQSLTDGLLSLLREDSSDQTLSPVSIPDLVSNVLTRVAPKAVERHIVVDDQTTPSVISVQPDSFERVLLILVDNAVKYSPDKSTITITNRETQKNISITITDKGQGIGPDDIDSIFNRFYRADKSRTGTGGYGLGLSIAKKIVIMHGGSIVVTSRLGEGSTFTVRLPK